MRVRPVVKKGVSFGKLVVFLSSVLTIQPQVEVEVVKALNSGGKMGYLGKSVGAPLSLRAVLGLGWMRVKSVRTRGTIQICIFSHIAVSSLTNSEAIRQLVNFLTIMTMVSVLMLIGCRFILPGVHLAFVLLLDSAFSSKFLLNVDLVHFDSYSFATDLMT